MSYNSEIKKKNEEDLRQARIDLENATDPEEIQKYEARISFLSKNIRKKRIDTTLSSSNVIPFLFFLFFFLILIGSAVAAKSLAIGIFLLFVGVVGMVIMSVITKRK